MEDVNPLVVLIIWLSSPVIGYLIGKSKGREGAGLLLGLLLGPLGWLLVAVGPNYRNKQVMNISEEKNNCPYCKELIIKGAIKCKHCGSMLNTATNAKQIMVSCPFCKEEIEEGAAICKHCDSKVD